MATKWKGWTARRPVKVFCVIMIPVLLFLSSFGVVGLAELDGVSADLLFADLNQSDYFYDQYITNAESWVLTLFWLQNEEHIRAMGCLEWQRDTEISYDVNGNPSQVIVYDLVSTNWNNQWHMGTISEIERNTSIEKQLVENAKRQQIRELQYAKNRIEGTPGLYYLINDEKQFFGNISTDEGADFFRSQPVYWINEVGKGHQRSRGSRDDPDSAASAPTTQSTPPPYSYDYPYGGYGAYYDDMSVYIAFSQEAVTAQNQVWRTAQRQLEIQLIYLILPLLAVLALLLILLAGAGRTYRGEAGQVRFLTIDKPWLDFSLCVLIAYEAALGYAVYQAMDAAWRNQNMSWITALSVVASVTLAMPALWWILSFTKRCKARRFWRHTLCYVFVRWIFTGIKKIAVSLWAGLRLTVRVVVIGAALLAGMVIDLALAWEEPSAALIWSALFSALAVFLLLRYTRKLHLVEQGAKAASGGQYDTPIPVNGGEMGSIAASINNISDGIHKAVAERMKSERLKTELITNISHDIRTPLTSLITYADLLKNEGLNHEKAPDYLEVLIQKSARLKTLTDDLFEASKAASGNIEVHIEIIDLADLARQVLGELDERVRGSGLDFRLNLPERAPARADGKLLWRVMENLLSNVFKYALAGSRVYIDIVSEDDWMRLDMKNISEHPLNVAPSELTERFIRGDEARGGEGSGLGLSIAQSFVQSQNGRFVLSIDGDLFKASVYLPAAPRNANIPPK